MTDGPDNSSALTIALRALELASSSDAVIKQHLVECRDRYVALRNTTLAGITMIMTTLLSVIGYLVTHVSVALN